MQNIESLRQEYTKFTLDADSVEKNPIRQFNKWFDEAIKAQINEPNAMNLATVNDSGRPSSRIVLLKGVENDQFVFYTNYQSQKGKELDLNPACALSFFWPELERQVRIEGIASRIEAERSDAYFQSRPRDSQIGAWASPQSSVISDRKILDERMEQIREKFKDSEKLPRPKQWGGYAVTPLLVEFWQGRPGRLHDRILYTNIDNTWAISRLAP